MSFRALDRVDPEIAQLIRNEFKRQSETLELIASENLTSPAILEALGTLLTNKYAEGYPGRRYYGGTGAVIDKTETLAIERAKAHRLDDEREVGTLGSMRSSGAR